jgi:hypothetical protein
MQTGESFAILSFRPLFKADVFHTVSAHCLDGCIEFSMLHAAGWMYRKPSVESPAEIGDPGANP